MIAIIETISQIAFPAMSVSRGGHETAMNQHTAQYANENESSAWLQRVH